MFAVQVEVNVPSAPRRAPAPRDFRKFEGNDRSRGIDRPQPFSRISEISVETPTPGHAQVMPFPSLSACRPLLAHRLCDPTQSSAPSVSSTNSASKEPKGTQDVSAGRMQSPGATGLLWKKAGTLLVLGCLGLVPRHSRGAPHVTPICLYPKKRLKLKFLLNRAFYCFQSPPKAISCPFACKTLSPKRQRPINM